MLYINWVLNVLLSLLALSVLIFHDSIPFAQINNPTTYFVVFIIYLIYKVCTIILDSGNKK